MPNTAGQGPQTTKKAHTLLWTIGTFAVGALAIWLFFHYEQYTSGFIRQLGPVGVIAAILLMALLCIIPFPAEFLMVIDMQVYGVWLGILYVWLGAMLGSYVTFIAAKHFGETWVRKIISPHYVDKLDEGVRKRGAAGLLIARLIPFIPFVVLNYASAMLKRVDTWTYLWTTGVGIMPYDIGAALVFLGFSRNMLLWLVIGGAAIAAIWLLAIWHTRRVTKEDGITPLPAGAPSVSARAVNHPDQRQTPPVAHKVVRKKRAHL